MPGPQGVIGSLPPIAIADCRYGPPDRDLVIHAGIAQD